MQHQQAYNFLKWLDQHFVKAVTLSTQGVKMRDLSIYTYCPKINVSLVIAYLT